MEEKVEELIDIYKKQIYSLCYKLAKTKRRRGRYFSRDMDKSFFIAAPTFLRGEL